MSLSIDEKISILEGGYHKFFVGNTIDILEKILFLLHSTKIDDLNIGFCLYYKNKQLIPDFKCIISSGDTKLLYEIGKIIGKDRDIKEWKHIFEISLRFSPCGELIKYAYYFINYSSQTIQDIRINYNIRRSYMEKTYGKYHHVFWESYKENKRVVGSLSGKFKYIDLLFFSKSFLQVDQTCIYTIHSGSQYYVREVSDYYNINIPNYISKKMSLYAICMEKNDFRNHSPDLGDISFYFGTY